MEKRYIEDKIKLGEGTKIEFKESKSSLTKDFYETAVSFSNCDGGIILLGVEDDGTICGVDRDRVKQIKADIATNLNSPDCVSPSIYINPIEMEFDEGIVIVVQVPSSSQVHCYSGDVYIRLGDVDINVSGDDEAVKNLYFRKSNDFTESQIYPYLTLDDLDPELFKRARTIIRNYRSDHPWLLIDDMQMLRESTLWRKDYKTGEEGLTLAAALIFGKDTTIQNMLPAYKVEAMVRIENRDRWDARITPRTNIIDTYLLLKKFINDNLPEKFYMEGDQRVDLRDKIFREVIGNVVVHREYTNPLSTDLIIYEDAVIVTNPNKPLFCGVLDPNSFNPYPKNPNIRKFFTAFGWTDEIGSGVRNTNKYLPIYSNGANPIFTEDQTFRTEIPLKYATLGDLADKWCEWLEIAPEMYASVKTSLRHIPISPSIVKLPFEEVLFILLSSWIQKATKLKNLSWPNNQRVIDGSSSSSSKKPSTLQPATLPMQVLRIKTRYYIAILSLCGEAISIKEITKALNYRDEAGFRAKYLKPLRESGLITLTIPDKPTSPDNKYIITPTGKEFLAGKE
ncbi:MAG: RNA-binding domain-containing protein [Rikenellaceae bacterium]